MMGSKEQGTKQKQCFKVKVSMDLKRVDLGEIADYTWNHTPALNTSGAGQSFDVIHSMWGER